MHIFPENQTKTNKQTKKAGFFFLICLVLHCNFWKSSLKTQLSCFLEPRLLGFLLCPSPTTTTTESSLLCRMSKHQVGGLKHLNLLGIIERQKHRVHLYGKMKSHQVIFCNTVLKEKNHSVYKIYLPRGLFMIKEMLIK